MIKNKKVFRLLKIYLIKAIHKLRLKILIYAIFISNADNATAKDCNGEKGNSKSHA